MNKGESSLGSRRASDVTQSVTRLAGPNREPASDSHRCRASGLALLGLAVAIAAFVVSTTGQAGARQKRAGELEFQKPASLDKHAPFGQISNVFGSPGIARNSHVATDGGGKWLAVWHATRGQGSGGGTDWDVLVSRSSDDGTTWSTPAPLNTNADDDAGNDLSPVAVTDEAGAWVVAWSSTESMRGSLGLDADILFARSADNGATWSTSAPLNVNAGSDYGEDRDIALATNGSGTWLAVWASTDSLTNRVGGDSDIFVARSTDNGATWTHPMPLNSNAGRDAGFDKSPDVVTDGSGRWIATWSSGDSLRGRIGSDRDILSSRSDDDGATWTDPEPLNTNAATDGNADWTPRLATDGRGQWVAVWTTADSLGDTIGVDRDVVVARSSDNGLTWTPPAPLDHDAAVDAREDSSPAIVTSGLGSWVAVWHSWSAFNTKGHVDADIVATHSSDDGMTWSAPIALNPDARNDSGDDVLPDVATDGRGHCIAVWQSFDVGNVTTAGPAWNVFAATGRVRSGDSARKSN